MLGKLGRRATSILLSSALLLGLAWGCASSAFDTPRGTPAGNDGSGGTNNPGDAFVKLDADQSDAGPQMLNPLCGVVGSGQTDGGVSCSQDGGDKDCPLATPHCDKLTLRCVGCVPDDREACVGFLPGAGGQAGEGGQAGQRSATPDASSGAGGASSGAGGEGGVTGEAGAAGEGGMSMSDAGIDNPPFGCQVSVPSMAGAKPVAACAPAGHGGVDAPCNNSGDCQAHLACVASIAGGSNTSSIPLCRPYCCEGDAACNSGMYCAERPLSDDRVASSGPDAAPPAQVPVCVPGDDCDLSTPYPCPTGAECLCKGPTACMVVRSGTTACVVPGKGQELEACPCAFGYVCSADANVCLKLCLVGGEQTCGQGLCQSVAGLPQAWGVCVGDTQPG